MTLTNSVTTLYNVLDEINILLRSVRRVSCHITFTLQLKYEEAEGMVMAARQLEKRGTTVRDGVSTSVSIQKSYLESERKNTVLRYYISKGKRHQCE